MPLRDHFRPPLDDQTSWDLFHGQWPAMIVVGLSGILPEGFFAGPQVHLGSTIEEDVATFGRSGGADASRSLGPGQEGGLATAVWAPPEAALSIATGPPDPDEYEVRVFDARRGRRLVAAIELVSPGNKDRPETRRAFVAKCSGLIREGVCVVVVDIVTNRGADFHAELMDHLGLAIPSSFTDLTHLSAVAYRWIRRTEGWSLKAWPHPLAIGQPLPTLPLWLASDLAVPLELEASYEETCRVLRIA